MNQKSLTMVIKQLAQSEIERASERNSFLNALSNFLYLLGIIAILVGIGYIFVGIANSDSYDDVKRMTSSSDVTTGILGAISGVFLFFFAPIVFAATLEVLQQDNSAFRQESQTHQNAPDLPEHSALLFRYGQSKMKAGGSGLTPAST